MNRPPFPPQPPAPPFPPGGQAFTLVFRCKTCGKALATCQGVTHAQLQQACANGARQVYCTEPGHVINANLAHEIVPYVPQAPPPPAIHPVGVAQVATPSHPVQGAAPGDPPAVPPEVDAVLKAAVVEQTAAIGAAAGGGAIAQARQHAPVAGEAPIYANGSTGAGAG